MERITELIQDGGIFECTGFSTVKVTRKGKASKIQLPIKSTGVAEFQESLKAKAPRPPVRFEVYKRGSKEAEELGVDGNVKLVVFDTTDEDYIDARDAHAQEFSWRVAVFALNIAWRNADGKEVTTYEEKKKILQSNGITGAHIDKIFRDVQALSKIEEDRQDFLSES